MKPVTRVGDKTGSGKRERTLGGDMLARCPDSHAEIASKVEVHKSLVTRWISGARKPTDDQMERLEQLYGIPPIAWKKTAVATSRPKAKPETTEPPPPSNTPREPEDDGAEGVPDAGRLHRFIRDGVRELETSDLPANKRAETLKKLVDAKVALDRSTGENALTMSRIAQHPEFQRVVRLIVAALEPYPEARAKVLEVLKAPS